MSESRPRHRTRQGPAVRIDVLGPLRVRGDGGEAVLAGGRARTLLACLAVRSAPTPAEVLADDLWPEDRPQRPRHALENHVSRLRNSLRAVDAADVVVHCGDGYALRGAATDAGAFESLVTEGRAAADVGDPSAASSLLRRADDLWRGDPFHGLPALHLFAVESARLEELRRRARDVLFDTELAVGRHDEIVDELRSDVVEDPLDERRRGQLMVALYRADRPARALQVYQDGVECLRRDLGVDPSPQLQRLYVAVLRHDVRPRRRPAASSLATVRSPRGASGDPHLAER